MKQYQSFIFESYKYDEVAKRISLNYSLDGEVGFEETYDLLGEINKDYSTEALDKALLGLWIMAGTSYYKAAVPPGIQLKQGSLTQNQADFFAKTYRLGLGEFAYENKLPLVSPVFPITETLATAVEVDELTGAILPVGGGKDSIVTAELIKGAGIPITTFRIGQEEQLSGLIETIGAPHFQVRRKLSTELRRVNDEGGYNGHVPITGILSFLAIAVAILTGKQDIVFSNEWSAGEGNTEYQGVMVNHQYTKSFEFEKDLQRYVRAHISPSLNYFSFLRPLCELRIAEVFTDRYFNTYKYQFSSCNRNFHLGMDNAIGWCGECPKCAFVFLLFSPFLSKDKLLGLFNGKNLFHDPKLQPTYSELLGLSGHKPFECVGEVEECRQAVIMALATGNYPELAVLNVTDPQFDYQLLQPASMPAKYLSLIKAI